MSKRGRKPKSQTAPSQRMEFIELGASARNRPTVTPTRQAISDSLLISDETRKKVDKEFNRSEEIVTSVLDLWYSDTYNSEEERNQIVSIKLCKILNFLYLRPLDPDGYVYTSIAYLSQLVPELFALSDVVTNTHRMLLKEPKIGETYDESQLANFQNPFRRNPSIPLLCVGVLYNSHKEILHWPLPFIQCYMEDAFNTRAWVDADAARLFVLNILTCLPISSTPGVNGNIATSAKVAAGLSENMINSQTDDNIIRNRWPIENNERIEAFVVKMVQFHEPRKDENINNFIRTMSTVASIPQTRALGCQYIEGKK